MHLKRFLAAAFVAIAIPMAWSQRFAVLSDIHVTPGNANDEQLRRAVSEINAGNFDAVIIDGDLTNEGSDEQLANVKSIVSAIRFPLYVLPGNHENNWSQSATKTFVDIFGNDRFVFKIDSLVVVGINCGPFMKMGDGHIKQEDLHWLKSTLDSLVTPEAKVLSFNHYPIRQNDLDNWRDYADILLQYPVIAHINGHYHRWIRYDAGDIECVMVRALDMGKGNYGYSIVDVTPQWTFVYDKQLGKDPVARFATSNRTNHTPIKDARIGFDKSNIPAGYDVTRVWADSASIFTRIGFDADNAYFATSVGNVRAIGKSDGQMRWSVRVPDGASVFSRPVALGGKKHLVAAPYCSGILVLDSRTGRIVRNITGKEGPYVADGLVSPDGKRYIQGGYKRIECRDAANPTKVIWYYDSIFNYCQAAPAIKDNDVVFGAWDTNLRCLDLRTGRLRWFWNNGKTANMLGPGNVVPVITEDKVFVVAPDRYMTALDRRTGKQLWRNNNHKYRESLGVSRDGSRVYAKTMDGELVAVDTRTSDFKELWTIDMGLGYEHAPCIVAEDSNGIVYAGSRRGIVTAVDPVAQKVVWSIPLGVSEVNGIDIDTSTGDVWVSLIEGTVFRISKK